MKALGRQLSTPKAKYSCFATQYRLYKDAQYHYDLAKELSALPEKRRLGTSGEHGFMI